MNTGCVLSGDCDTNPARMFDDVNEKPVKGDENKDRTEESDVLRTLANTSSDTYRIVTAATASSSSSRDDVLAPGEQEQDSSSCQQSIAKPEDIGAVSSTSPGLPTRSDNSAKKDLELCCSNSNCEESNSSRDTENQCSTLSRTSLLDQQAHSSQSVHCPLCGQAWPEPSFLEEHIVKEHNVGLDGLRRLLSMVDLTRSSSSSSTMKSSESLTTSSLSDITRTATASSLEPLRSSSSPTLKLALGNVITSSTINERPEITVSLSEEATTDQESKENMNQEISRSHEPKIKENSKLQFCQSVSAPVVAVNGTPSLEIHFSLNHLPQPRSSSSQSSSTAGHSSLPGTSVIERMIAPQRQNVLENDKQDEAMIFLDEVREINIDELEAENLYVHNRGIDLTTQEKMHKEQDDMFSCQNCSTPFSDIDQLFSHQNELGHLELKQTPRGPGYLCWKRGCSQYFKTAMTLQVHFREIHAKNSALKLLPPQELELYKFKCEQCAFGFKSQEDLRSHTLIHMLRLVTQCSICLSRFKSVKEMRRHLELGHKDLDASIAKAQFKHFEGNVSLLSSMPIDFHLSAKIFQINGDNAAKNENSTYLEKLHNNKLLINGVEKKDSKEQREEEEDMDESDAVMERYKLALDEYMNSPPMAVEHYKSSDRKYRCNLCKMAFTDHHFLAAHNKTSLHRCNEQMNHVNDTSKPYRCDICKESYETKLLLQAHFSSDLHLQKQVQLGPVNGDNLFLPPTSHIMSSSLSSSQASLSLKTKMLTGNYNTLLDMYNGDSTNLKPYQCNICKVSYSNQASIDIHFRSVGHKTKASKLGELFQSEQIELNQVFKDQPDSRTSSRQQAQIIADLIHQQATAQAASNIPPSFFSLQALQDINIMTQMSLLGAIQPTSYRLLESSAASSLAGLPNTQSELLYSSAAAQNKKDGIHFSNLNISNAHDSAIEKFSKTGSNPNLAEKTIDNAGRDSGESDPLGDGKDMQINETEIKASGDVKSCGKEDDLHPNFHAPLIARPRGFMGRFKPHLHRSLLENFGFECVMHFNEENTCKSQKAVQEETNKEQLSMELENEAPEDKEMPRDKEDLIEEESNIKQENVVKSDEEKENIDIPELNKCYCKTCEKDFSNVWVLKNHEEEVHNHFVSSEIIEDFGQKFKEEWEKNLPKHVEQEQVQFPQSSPNPPTSSVASVVEKIPTFDMPPPPTPAQSQFSSNFDMSQLLPFMNIIPMHLPMTIGLQNSLIPPLMVPSFDLSQSFLPHMPQQTVLESPGCVNSQQAAAAALAQNQKRARTRISDDQLKVLRQYFDINNSPTEEQVSKMADQTGLPQKVIKHWFRNTLFKERQRNKDSPYNFNNPPSTSIDLDEYDRTGKIPEIKMEPEEYSDKDSNPGPDVKNEAQAESEKPCEDKHESDTDLIDRGPLKIDLTTKPEPLDEVKRDEDSHSNMSSPSISSVPLTPTASAPETPTLAITSSSIMPTYSQAFGLDSYVASFARREAPTFHNLSKRANRTRFTDYQIKTLQDYFERNAYPKDDDLDHLSKILGLGARVIVVWFQNARQKARKIYENQPPNDGLKEPPNPFQKTPGMNHQCRKCDSVFLRYYELIKHQKSSCAREPNNSNGKLAPLVTEDDSDFSYSNDESSFTDQQGNPVPGMKDRDMHPWSHTQEQQAHAPAVKVPTIAQQASSLHPSSSSSSSSSSLSSSSSSSSSIPSLKCDKCALTFFRFDKLQEHLKLHSTIPGVHSPPSSSSAFGMLQALPQQDDSKSAFSITTAIMPSTPNSSATHQLSPLMTTPLSSSASTSPSAKRKTDSEDESFEQPRDKRLRTTILPEQLDYLYQQYQNDCNPSRKQLEQIASSVNLKKRVVQVWFQNTRARERKGHYRAHQQLINKRCPFCRALFRAKSALESHLATKHPEEMAKEEINIDLIPDAVFESGPIPSSPVTSSSLGLASASDISKFLPPTAAASAMISNYMPLMHSANNFNLPLSAPTLDILNSSQLEGTFVKKYMNDLICNMTSRQDHSMLPSQSHISSSSSCSTLTYKPQAHQAPPILSSLPQQFDNRKLISTSQPQALQPSDDTPLDLSKPVKSSNAEAASSDTYTNHSTNLDSSVERSVEFNHLRRVNSMDDSFSETLSEMADHEYMNDIGNSPPSPTHTANGFTHNSSFGSGKRYRTQMSALQVKVMKHLFENYKTPSMTECELLGQEIGLAKRVVQVWFQNARAKEKKAKLSSGNLVGADVDFPKTPEECKLCNCKYTHKVTIQDHIFTKAHIDRIKAFLSSQGDLEPELPVASIASISRTQVDNGFKNLEKGSPRKDKKLESLPVDDKQHSQSAMKMAANAQMLSALGGFMPGLDPSYLPFMYGGLPSYFPLMRFPMIQPGIIPEQMLAYDSLAFGTPLALLQIPPAAITSVSDKLADAGAVLARYTQDCQALADLNMMVSTADLTVAAEATLDVGYICKKCQMVFPMREYCVLHQRSVCLTSPASLPKGFEPIIKLEQVQYECRACSKKYSTILQFKSHCQKESHKQALMKFKANEAARCETSASPSSSAPYTSSSMIRVTSSPPAHSSKPQIPSPSNINNNNSSNHNHNQITAPNLTQDIKSFLLPSSANHFNKMSPTA